MGHFAKILAGASACIWLATPGLAQTVGRAVSVVPNAQVDDRALATGDPLAQNARIRTEPKGSARIRFLDDTLLTVGPSATIVLDRTIFDADRAQNVALTVTGGALRFVTGVSSRSAYQIGTPAATIGVRGTILDLRVSGSRTVVNMIDGEADVCLRSTGACRGVRAGDQPLAATPSGFRTASPTEAASLWQALDTAHFSLDRRIGVDPTGAQQSAAVREAARASGGGDGGSFGIGPISSSALVPGLSTFTVLDPIALPAGAAPIAIPTNSPEAPIVVVPPASSPGSPPPGAPFPPPIGPSPFDPSTTSLVVATRSALAFPTAAGPRNALDDIVPAGAVTFDTAQALRSFTVTSTQGPLPGPFTVTRGTAAATDVFTGTTSSSGGGSTLFQIGAFRNGTVNYSDAFSGSSGTLDFGPNQALHYISAALLPSTFSFPYTFGNLLTYSLEAATRPSWSDGRSAPGLFTGTMSVGIGSLALYFGLSGNLAMTEGNFSLQTTGGAANPYLSAIVFINQANTGLIGIGGSGLGILSGPGVVCSGLCADLRVTLTSDRLLLNYDAPVTPGGASLQGVAAFSPSGAAQGQQFVGGVGGFTGSAQAFALARPQSDLGTGMIESDLTLSRIDLASGESRVRAGASVIERGSAPAPGSGVPVVGWERWTNGNVTANGSTTAALTSNQGLHVIHGLPAFNFPTNTLLTYNLIGSTSPTIGDGSLAPGTLTAAQLGVQFGPTAAGSKVGLDLTASIGGTSYSVSTTGGASNPTASSISLLANGRFSSGATLLPVSGTGAVCPSAGSCRGAVDGFLAGNGATHAGLLYQFGPFLAGGTVGIISDGAVHGAAGLAR